MATANEVIRSALKKLGVIASSESATADQAADGLSALKAMLDSWSVDNLTVPYITTETYSLVSGQANYTYGPSGDFNSTRPQEIVQCYLREVGQQNDQPVTITYRERYNLIPDKAAAGRPYLLYVVPDYPLFKLFFDNAPDASYQAVFDVLHPLTKPSALTDSLSFPPGYEKAIIYNLAMELAPEYEREPSSLVVFNAEDSLKRLKRRNIRVPVLGTEMGRTGIYNVYTD